MASHCALIVGALLLPGCTLPACDLIDSHQIAASQSSVPAGHPVTFTATFDLDRDARREASSLGEHNFDLDGDGTFEAFGDTFGDEIETVTTSYPTARTVEVAHLVIAGSETNDFARDESVARTVVTVQPPGGDPAEPAPPLASFTASPNPVQPEATSLLDASASRAPGGSIVRYEWDLDGNGGYELDNGADPTTETAFADLGDHIVGLRVTDGAGNTGATTRTIVVKHAVPIGAPPQALVAAALERPIELELAASAGKVRAGTLLLNGETLLGIGRTARGRIASAPFPAKLRDGRRRVRWAAKFDTATEIGSGASTATGLIRFSYPAGGQSCLAFEVDAPDGAEPTGTFRVIGGSGASKRLRGKGTGTAALAEDSLELSGRGRLRQGRPWPALSPSDRACDVDRAP